MPDQSYIKLAVEMKKKAHAPYSNFHVGVVLMTKDGTVFTGVNVENSSYSLTCCAERIAIFKAVSEGFTEFTEMYLAGDSEGFTPPCGACRQVMVELCGLDLQIHMINKNDHSIQTVTVRQLVPFAFSADNLPR